MTTNPKPNELPEQTPIEDITPSVRPLLVDMYLDMAEIAGRVFDHYGLDPSWSCQDERLDHTALARAYKAEADDPRRVRTIKRHLTKPGLIAALSNLLGFDADGQQGDELRKSQMIHWLIVIKTGEQPPDFRVPSDPEHTANTPDQTRIPGGAD